MKFKALSNDQRELEVRWDLVNTYLSRWKPGTLLNIEITRRQAKKSDPMRKYYFGVVIKEFMKHLGYEPDEEMLFHRQLNIIEKWCLLPTEVQVCYLCWHGWGIL